MIIVWMIIFDDFIFGVVVFVWQIEGWSGKKSGQDFWFDFWYKNDCYVWYNGYGLVVVIDFINCFQEDVQLMKLVGLIYYCILINWLCFLIDYENVMVDEEYVVYYDQLFDVLLVNGIMLMICFEYYELFGYLLEKYGGWGLKMVVELFVCYVEKVFVCYYLKVMCWFIFNELIVVQIWVYLDVLCWFYEQNISIWMQWNYYKVLVIVSVVKWFCEFGYFGIVGCIFNLEVIYLCLCVFYDLCVVEIYDLFYNCMFFDLLVYGVWLLEFFVLFEQYQVMWEISEEDLVVICEYIVDELGINFYYLYWVKVLLWVWYLYILFYLVWYYELFELFGWWMNVFCGWEIYL